MKRIVCLLLTFFYLFASIGVSAKSMYCLGILRSSTISYNLTEVKKPDCKMSTRVMRKCCKTKTELLKVKDQHTYTGPLDLLAKFFPVLFGFPHNDAPTCTSIILVPQHYYSHAPPSSLKTPAYVLNCSYRI